MSETLHRNDALERSYPADSGTLAKELLKLFPNDFTTDLEENKILVFKLIVTESKALRNKVAGHITRLKGREASGQIVTVPYVNSSSEGRRRRGRTRRR
jgi:ribosomal protein S17E